MSTKQFHAPRLKIGIINRQRQSEICGNFDERLRELQLKHCAYYRYELYAFGPIDNPGDPHIHPNRHHSLNYGSGK